MGSRQFLPKIFLTTALVLWPSGFVFAGENQSVRGDMPVEGPGASLSSLCTYRKDCDDLLEYFRRDEAARIHLRQGWELFQGGQLDEAIKEYSRGLGLDPVHETYRYYLFRAAAYYQKGEDRMAVSEATKALDVQEEEVEAVEKILGKGTVTRDIQIYLLRGRAYYRQGRLDEALRDSFFALQIDRDNPDAYFLKGLVFFSKQRWGSAIAAFTECLHHASDKKDVLLYRAIANLYDGNMRQAQRDFNSYIETQTNDADAYFLMGQALYRKSLVDQAEADRISSSPGRCIADERTRSWVVRHLDSDDDYRKASLQGKKRMMEEALKASVCPEIWDLTLQSLQEGDAAISALRSAVRLREANADYRYVFGLALENRGLHQEATKEYDRVLGLRPDHQHKDDIIKRQKALKCLIGMDVEQNC